MGYRIINKDVLEGLAEIEDNSIQCCVTSPPYWGLRDYGTAQWQGGDEKCDHKKIIDMSHSTLEGGKATQENAQFYKDICGKCRAARVDNQIGLEKTPEEYIDKMVKIFTEVRRVLKKDGTLWLNLGDSYNGAVGSSPSNNGVTSNKQASNKGAYRAGGTATLKPKDLCMIPARVAIALQQSGWWLRQDIIWSKPNPMPESVRDRCTKSHEYIFLLTKSGRYYYDADAIKELATRDWNKSGGNIVGKGVHKRNDGYSDLGNGRDVSEVKENRNRRSVWEITTQPYSGAHFATFPEEIPTLCIKAGSKKGDTILDPFCGSGTTGDVALRLERNFIGIELNEKYVKDLIIPRLENIDPLFR